MADGPCEADSRRGSDEAGSDGVSAAANGGASDSALTGEGRQVIELEEDFWTSALPGDLCYAIEYSWWQRWCDYVGVRVENRKRVSVEELPDGAERPPHPGPIDNAGLKEPASNVREGIDFTFKSPATWALFSRLYPGSGPEVSRPLLLDGRAEIFNCHYYVYRSSELEEGKKRRIFVSKHATIGDVKRAACAVFGLEEVDVRLWDFYQGSKYGTDSLEALLDKALQSQTFPEGQDLLLEEKVDDKFSPTSEDSPVLGALPRPSLLNRYTLTPEDTVNEADGSAAEGTAGLANLGNTCFMNSSVQCLAHTLPLMRVFLSGAYEADLNRDNPLGNKGQLAEAFGSLMKKLWQSNARSVSPKKFKHQIANFAPHFAGYQQHDSQELLAFLLDGLHEDLNRVKNKPYIEEPDSEGRPDEALAAEAWRNYKARNDSYIVDHFQGMYKSTLVCPDCGFHSVKMDSFNCLSLPLPAAKMRTVEVTVVTMDGSAPPVQYALEVLKLGTIGDLYRSLARVCGVAAPDPLAVLLLVEIYGGKVHRKFTDAKEPLADGIRGSVTLLAYRYPSPEVGPASGGKELHVFQRRARKRPSYYYNGEKFEVFAAPLLLWLSEDRIRAATSQSADGVAEALLAGQGPLKQAVETALRPFKRQRIDAEAESAARSAQGDEPAPPEQELMPIGKDAPEGGPATAGAAKESATLASIRQWQSGASSSATDLSGMDAAGPARGAGGPPDGPSAGAEGAAVLDSGALSISPRETPQTSPVMSPVGTPRNDSGESTSFQASIGDIVPFDMFQAQQPAEPPIETREPAAAAPAAASPASLPYSIRVAQRDGQPACGAASLDDGQLYFAIEWAADAGAQYEPERIEQPQLHASVREAKAREAAGPRPHTLDECVEAFLEGERLEDSESWFCKRCRRLVQADKKLDLWCLPEVLVIHLKRFSYSHRFRDKIDALVRFPLTGLDLGSATIRRQAVEPIYDLYAVSNHFGGLGGGHYTAFCKLSDDGRWYCFDDSTTYEVPAERVMSPAAYVLFYRRRVEAGMDAGKSVAKLLAQPSAEFDAASRETSSSVPSTASTADDPMAERASRAASPERAAANPLAEPPPPPAAARGRCCDGDRVQEAPANGLLTDSMEWSARAPY